MNLEPYNAKQLADLFGEQTLLANPNLSIQYIITDSRKISDPITSVFFVLEGRKDAHQFIDSLYHKGVRCFVYSDKSFNISLYPEANFIYTSNTLAALQRLAAFHRLKFNYPVIGITGSNGKTIVKEWLFQLLVPDFRVIRSPKSYNSQIGVPLSVWQMDKQFDYGIFEAGISLPGEMEKLQQIIKPDIGVLTNIGTSHDEGFLNQDQKIKEKFTLFKDVKVLVCNQTYAAYNTYKNPIFTWSFNTNADLKVIDVETKNGITIIKALYQNRELKVQIHFTDKASIENAVVCWATLLALNINQEIIAARIEKLLSVKMRLELKSGINQTSIIDDSYNSDFSSLEIALDFLNQQNQHPQKTLILSDIHQSGLNPEQLYQKLAQLLKNKNIDRLIGIGKDMKAFSSLFKKNSSFYKDTENFLASFHENDFNDETILLKGARHFEFEKISKVLTEKVHETILEINLNALEDNLNFYKSKLRADVKMMAMVKAFAYGSGSYEIANILQFNRVDYLAVAYADEGVALRQAGITLPIMVMSPEVSSFEAIIQYNLEPEIYSFRVLESLTQYLKTHKKTQYHIHLKVDTGMHRLGFEPADLEKIVAYLNQHPVLKVKSVFSHLAASEATSHNDYTRTQINIFKEFCDKLQNRINYSFIKHISNTSAISRWPEAQFDMVRLGIGLYGVDKIAEDSSKPYHVATLKTTVSQIKHLKKNDSVGYGRAGVMPYDGEIATVKIGYADGYSRAFGNGIGSMFINGKEVFTIGNICMDMCMLDVTGKNIKEGDEVIVFGSKASLYKMSAQLNTIPYEVITGISQRVKRIYYYE